MFIYPIYNNNWRNISAIYIYNKTIIKRNILTIKKKIHREVGRAKDLSAPLYKGNKLQRQKILSFIYPIYVGKSESKVPYFIAIKYADTIIQGC